jgi:hypothetical protein
MKKMAKAKSTAKILSTSHWEAETPSKYVFNSFWPLCKPTHSMRRAEAEPRSEEEEGVEASTYLDVGECIGGVFIDADDQFVLRADDFDQTTKLSGQLHQRLLDVLHILHSAHPTHTTNHQTEYTQF